MKRFEPELLPEPASEEAFALVRKLRDAGWMITFFCQGTNRSKMTAHYRLYEHRSLSSQIPWWVSITKHYTLLSAYGTSAENALLDAWFSNKLNEVHV